MMSPNIAATRRLQRGCILFFFLYMSHGIAGPYLPVIWRDKGLSGMLGAMRAVASFFGSPAICALADKSGRHQEVLYVLLVAYAIARPSVLMVGCVLGVAASEISASILEHPINSLTDSAARRSLGGGGYGRQRLFGSLGFGLASLIGGFIYDAGGGSYRNVMVAFVVATMVAFVAATRVPIGKLVEPDDSQESGGLSKGHGRGSGYITIQELSIEFGEPEADSDGEASGWVYANAIGSTLSQKISADTKGYINSYGASGSRETDMLLAKKGEQRSPPLTVWAAISTVRTASFLSAVVLSGMGWGVIDTFLFIRLQELGGSHTLLGVARLIMCLAEVPCFYISGALIRRLGARGVVALAQVAYLTRFLYYSVLTEPWLVLPVETLHGLTFATMWAATIEYAHGIAPVGQQASLVGLLSGLHFGLGVGLGALVGGVLYVVLGASVCFRVCTALPTCSLLLLAFPAVQRWIKYGGSRWKEGGGETDF